MPKLHCLPRRLPPQGTTCHCHSSGSHGVGLPSFPSCSRTHNLTASLWFLLGRHFCEYQDTEWHCGIFRGEMPYRTLLWSTWVRATQGYLLLLSLRTWQSTLNHYGQLVLLHIFRSDPFAVPRVFCWKCKVFPPLEGRNSYCHKTL